MVSNRLSALGQELDSAFYPEKRKAQAWALYSVSGRFNCQPASTCTSGLKDAVMTILPKKPNKHFVDRAPAGLMLLGTEDWHPRHEQA